MVIYTVVDLFVSSATPLGSSLVWISLDHAWSLLCLLRDTFVYRCRLRGREMTRQIFIRSLTPGRISIVTVPLTCTFFMLYGPDVWMPSLVRSWTF